MIFVDVTNTCKSALPTGVPRTVRGVIDALHPHTPITPILWDNSQNTYCRLSRREEELLAALPRKPFPHWIRGLQHRWNAFSLENTLTPQDTLLIPEIFQDRRIEYLLQLRTQAPLRAIFHDAIAWTHAEFTAPERRPRFTDYLQTLHRFDEVTCVSREAESDLRTFWSRHSVPPTKTRTISWPTDFPQIPRGISGNFNAKRILYVASLEARKNHLLLLEAAERLWERNLRFELLLIGKNCPDGGATIQERLHHLRDRHHPARWLNQVDDSSLHEEYRKSSFTVYPSIKEGFGLPILESLWHGRPSLCGNEGAIAETAKGGGCLTVDCRSTDSIVAGIETLLTDEAKYQQLVQEASSRTFPTWQDYGTSFLSVPSH